MQALSSKTAQKAGRIGIHILFHMHADARPVCSYQSAQIPFMPYTWKDAAGSAHSA